MTPEEKKLLAKKKGVAVRTINTWIKLYGEEDARNRLPVSKADAARIGKKKSPWKHFQI